MLLVLVKPLALLLSIELDADKGLSLAQIYLIGLIFISMSGTNAHRPFYQLYFGKEEVKNKRTIARSYVDYIRKITLQLVLVLIASSILASIIFWGSIETIIVGILFGLGEKINDEYQRLAQFLKNDRDLFKLALSKLIPVLVAVSLSYASIVDIRIIFPALLLLGSIFINRATLKLSIAYLIKTTSKSLFLIFSLSYNHIRKDILQIACVFIGMSLLSLDKWTVQYFSLSDLPNYMLYTQIASLFVVSQTIILIAPVRARLVNENPLSIKSIKIGSPLISMIPLSMGIFLYFYEDPNGLILDIGFFAFFFAAIALYSVAYLERLYWATTAKLRLTLDSTIAFLFILISSAFLIFWPSLNFPVVILAILFCLMCLRAIGAIYLLRKVSLNKE